MKTSLLIIFAAIIFWAVNPLITSAQEPDKSSENYILSDKQAKSQTKAMVQFLDLKEPATNTVYNINLKYQLLINSLRMSATQVTTKKEMHVQYAEQKNTELKSILSTEQYNKYISLLGDARTQLNNSMGK